MRVRVIPVLIGLALVGAACTSNGGGQTAQSTQAVTSGDGTSKPPGTTATDKPTETKRNKDAKPYAETVKLAIDDIQDWWAKTMPEVYDKKYTAIPDAKIYAVTPKKPAPACTPRRCRWPCATTPVSRRRRAIVSAALPTRWAIVPTPRSMRSPPIAMRRRRDGKCRRWPT